MDIEKNSVSAELLRLGLRLRHARLSDNLTQRALADRVGVSEKTVKNAEDGRNVSLETFLLLLRGVGRLGDIEYLLADPGPSPVELAERQGQRRQRASGSRARPDEAEQWKW